MNTIVKVLLFSCLSFVALIPNVNSDEAPITITFKNPEDCPDAGEPTMNAFLENYAKCAFKHLGGELVDSYDVDGGYRQLQSCNNCNTYCNCRADKPRSYCASTYPGCFLACGCGRRNLIDASSPDYIILEGDTVTEELFEEVVIAEGSPTLQHEVYGNDLWKCACDELKKNGIDGTIFHTNTSNMCNCINKSVDTWTNMD